MTLSMEAEGIALPESAWAQRLILPAEIATSAAHAAATCPLPTRRRASCCKALAADGAGDDAADPAGARQVVAEVAGARRRSDHDDRADRDDGGPLKYRRAAEHERPADLQQHLNALASQINTLHDPKMLGEQSPAFTRAKYELSRCSTCRCSCGCTACSRASRRAARSRAPTQTFVTQIGHAARVPFQPLLQHALRVIRYIQTLPTDEVGGSMPRRQYPADTATDADRVEWLQLNLCAPATPRPPRPAPPSRGTARPPPPALPPRPPPPPPASPSSPTRPHRPHAGCCSSRRCARTLCNHSIYQAHYTQGEAQLFSGFSASRRSTPT